MTTTLPDHVLVPPEAKGGEWADRRKSGLVKAALAALARLEVVIAQDKADGNPPDEPTVNATINLRFALRKYIGP